MSSDLWLTRPIIALNVQNEERELILLAYSKKPAEEKLTYIVIHMKIFFTQKNSAFKVANNVS